MCLLPINEQYSAMDDTMTVPDYHVKLAVSNQSRIDREFDRGEKLNDLRDELRHDMQRALAGFQPYVPSWQRMQSGSIKEKLSNPADESLFALDNMECCEALMAVLRDSTCPLVATMRKAIVSRYVRDTAEGLAEARGL